jgi:hypothetical protein
MKSKRSGRRAAAAAMLAAGMWAWAGTAARAADEAALDEAAIHGIIHILHHEIGHALIDQFQLPVLGQEEDAADAYATITILETYDDPQPILIDAAAAWFAMHDRSAQSADEPDYFGEHDLDIQRGYRIICQAHGYDPDTFEQAAADVELPEDRLESCAADTRQILDGWARLLDGITKDDDTPGGKITVEYRAAGGLTGERQLLEDSGALEEVARWLDAAYLWPQPLTIAAETCDEENAFYASDKREITMCYEMVAYMRDLAAGFVE